MMEGTSLEVSVSPMIELVVVGLVCIILCFIVILCYPRSSVSREIGFAEGIDDAAVGEAFNTIQRLPQFKMVRNRIISHVIKPQLAEPIGDGATLLDLGCGTGHLLMAFHEVAVSGKAPKLRLLGIDLGAESVRICRERLSDSGLADVDVREGDGASMPYPDSTMNVVVTSLSLHHWTEPIRVFNEMYRVICPGGLLVLLDMRRDARKFWYRLLAFATRVVVPKALRHVREPLGSLLASYTFEELEGLLSRTYWANAEHRLEGFFFAQILEARKPDKSL
jgi:ubiquinone/menaquinone biosynthesis C-methylase UbiE